MSLGSCPQCNAPANKIQNGLHSSELNKDLKTYHENEHIKQFSCNYRTIDSRVGEISFLPGKYCRIVRNGNGYNAVITNPHLKTNANTEQIIKALCLLQNIVIQKLPSRPDLLANTRLKTIFMFSIQSDMIFAPFPVIKKLNEELVQFFR